MQQLEGAFWEVLPMGTSQERGNPTQPSFPKCLGIVPEWIFMDKYSFDVENGLLSLNEGRRVGAGSGGKTKIP